MLMLATCIAAFSSQNITSLMVQPIIADMGWNRTEMAAALTIAGLVGALAAPLAGFVVDRYGARGLMPIGALLMSGALLLLSNTTTLAEFLLAYMVVRGIGPLTMSGPVSQATIVNWFLKKRGRATGITSMTWQLFVSIFAPIAGVLVQTRGWRSVFSTLSIAALAGAVPMALLLRRRPEDVGLLPDGDWKPTEKEAQRAPKDSDVSWTLREAFETRALWTLLGTFVIGGSTMSMMTSLAPYLTLKYQMSNQAVGWVISGFWVPATVSRLIWGYLIDKLPARICLSTCALGRGIGVISLILVPYPYNIGTWMFFSGLVGNSFGILQPVMFANFFGRRAFATIQGGVRPLMAVPGLILPLLVARLYDVSGTFTWGFLLCGSLGFIGAFAALFAAPPTKRESAAKAPP